MKRVDEFLCTPEYEVRKDKIYDKVSKIMLDTFEKQDLTLQDIPRLHVRMYHRISWMTS